MEARESKVTDKVLKPVGNLLKMAYNFARTRHQNEATKEVTEFL